MKRHILNLVLVFHEKKVKMRLAIPMIIVQESESEFTHELSRVWEKIISTTEIYWESIEFLLTDSIIMYI